MDDFDQSFHEFQQAERARRAAIRWLTAFETALVSRDPAKIADLFHADSHWRDNQSRCHKNFNTFNITP